MVKAMLERDRVLGDVGRTKFIGITLRESLNTDGCSKESDGDKLGKHL